MLSGTIGFEMKIWLHWQQCNICAAGGKDHNNDISTEIIYSVLRLSTSATYFQAKNASNICTTDTRVSSAQLQNHVPYMYNICHSSGRITWEPGPLKDVVAPAKHLVWEGTRGPVKGHEITHQSMIAS